MYQTTGFQKKTFKFYKSKKKVRVDLTNFRKPRKREISEELRINKKSNIYNSKKQLCDLSESDFNEIIKKNRLDYITSKTGWLT